MATVTYHNVLDMAQKLSPTERLRLLEELTKTIRQETQPTVTYKLSDLKGLGKELWQTVDIEKYLHEEREAWDG